MVSGRSLVELRDHFGLDGVGHLVGSHGAESSVAAPLDQQEQRLLDEVADALGGIVGATPGATLENKPMAVALHVRGATPEDARHALSHGTRRCSAWTAGCEVHEGHQVYEVAVRHTTKAVGAGRAARRAGAGDGGVPRRRPLRRDGVRRRSATADLGVKVGVGPTAARWRLAAPADVVEVLAGSPSSPADPAPARRRGTRRDRCASLRVTKEAPAMAWDFETDPEYQAELDWARDFVRTEVEPLDFVIKHPYDMTDPIRQELIPPLQEKVKDRGLWACHLGPELGGPGYGQVKLALLNEILGRPRAAPIVFGCQAPDSGNAEILAHYGTPEQKERYLKPLLDNEIVSCFSMTEPQGGADPKVFTTRPCCDGDEWVINGEKWFSSHARYASFLIVMAVTDPDNPPYQQMSMFIVPTDTPGVEIIRNVGLGYEQAGEGTHAYIRYTDVRVPHDDHARRPRRGLRRRPDPPRRRPHPPRDAHRRPGAARPST